MGNLDLDKSCFVYSVHVTPVRKNMFFSLNLSIRIMLELLVLKTAAECTCQSLKWTGGARVMTIFGRSVARSVARSLGRSVARSLGRSVARSLDRPIARSIACSIARTVPRSISKSIARSIVRAIAHSIARSIARHIDRSIAHSIACPIARSIARSLGRSLGSWEKSADQEDHEVARWPATHPTDISYRP